MNASDTLEIGIDAIEICARAASRRAASRASSSVVVVTPAFFHRRERRSTGSNANPAPDLATLRV